MVAVDSSDGLLRHHPAHAVGRAAGNWTREERGEVFDDRNGAGTGAAAPWGVAKVLWRFE